MSIVPSSSARTSITPSSSARQSIPGYWRRGTVEGHLAYIRVAGHTRTGNPAPPTKKNKTALVDPSRHSVVKQCALPKPRDAVKMKQAQQSVQKPALPLKPTIETVD